MDLKTEKTVHSAIPCSIQTLMALINILCIIFHYTNLSILFADRAVFRSGFWYR